LGTAAAEGSGGGNLPAVGVHPAAALVAFVWWEEAGVLVVGVRLGLGEGQAAAGGSGMGVSREEERRSRGAIGWMKLIVEWRNGGRRTGGGRFTGERKK
jgi:hypothetical protein